MHAGDDDEGGDPVTGNWRKVLRMLTEAERRRGMLILLMLTVMATTEAAGVASVAPFLSVLGDPSVVDENRWLSALRAMLGIESPDRFLVVLGLLSFAMIALSATISSLVHVVINRYVEMRRHGLSSRLLESYLRQPYAFFLERNSSELAKRILSEVDHLVTNVLRPGMDMVAYGVVALAIVALLIVIDPFLALTVASVIGGAYVAVFLGVRKLMARAGETRAESNRQRFAAASEALGGVKSIKLMGLEHAYLQRFVRPSTRFSQTVATNKTASQVPKFIIESIAIGGVILIAVVLVLAHGGAEGEALGKVLPILGLYVLGGYRLLPAVQRIYQAFAKLQFAAPAINELHSDLESRQALEQIRGEPPLRPTVREHIAFRDVTFRYAGTREAALDAVSFELPIGSSLGIVGSTGAGKTTLVDVLLGLLRPASGDIALDDVALEDSGVRGWQRCLGYVPQDIYLLDATIAENIAFGIAATDVDHARVRECARMASLDAFVEDRLPEGYATVVGERGVRLSGGQRQRIGIARALYHDPDVLILDEATSALDNVTERDVMDAIEALSGERTIIAIAHRLTTVRACDRILMLDAGRVVALGTYADLEQDSAPFREFVHADGQRRSPRISGASG